MKCIECGHELKDGAIFCIRCGAMQVSMDGKPIERGEDWPSLDAADGSGYRSSTEGAMHAAQSKSMRSFNTAPKRNGGKIAAIVVIIIALIAGIVFAAVSCNSQATSGTASSGSAAATTTTSSESASATSSTASTSASAASTSASAASTSASAASASASAASTTTTTVDASQRQVEPQPEPEPEYNDYYILPDSSSYYYSYGELSGMSSYDLYLARNEIFARHGRMFNNADLQEYFNSQAWYEPIYSPSQFDSMGNVLNDVEQKNVNVMRQIEKDQGSPYL